MGWDSDVIIIAEKIDSVTSAQKIARQIFDLDSKEYGAESFYIIQGASDFSIYYHFTRRKFAPYWIVQDISKQHETIQFTILVDILEYIGGGPSGLFRIEAGELVDSYGIESSEVARRRILDDPIVNREMIYDWFQNNGKEQILRNNYSYMYPIGSCEEQYSEKLIPISSTELVSRMEQQRSSSASTSWKLQKRFE